MAAKSNWCVYLLQGKRGVYTGATVDLKRRIHEHNNVQSRAAKWCWANRPLTLITATLPTLTQHEALAFEYRVKMQRSPAEKLKLIKQTK